KGLDARIDVFWTGPKVLSDTYPRSHLLQVADKLGRKPLLWDNYPVNDAKRLTPFLHLRPFTGRSRDLRDLTSGQLANPMNQPYLSQLPLYTLAAIYASPQLDADAQFADACKALCPPELADALQQDAASFQTIGLDGFNAATKAELLHRYAAFPHPMAREICAWLRGEYAFDPACLT
ncbi:MAG: beta-N-acetylglucosaminidase domain-containing protein, partial [Rhodanobacter sp.]